MSSVWDIACENISRGKSYNMLLMIYLLLLLWAMYNAHPTRKPITVFLWQVLQTSAMRDDKLLCKYPKIIGSFLKDKK